MSSGPNIHDADRIRKPRRFTLSPEVNEALDILRAKDEDRNLSKLADEALRAHPDVAKELK